MTCQELREHYELYALGSAEEPERSEIRAHLNRDCEACMAGVKGAMEAATMLGATAPPAEPSAKLRRRILAAAGGESRNASWVVAWTAIAGLAASVLLLVFVLRDRGRYMNEALRSRNAFAILYGPNTVEASFGGAQPRPPRGTVFVNPSQGVLLIASNLPPTPVDKIYEMWLIPKSANPVPAGLFQSFSDGQAMHIRPGAVDMASTAAVAVTVENAAGAAQPTTTPLIVAPLSR
ncbi:MAG TPA: anti-sigma factor [Bryobacteraceae bacterium]|nr:anti-sigma factor [Bryobacteraceae bacterium]